MIHTRVAGVAVPGCVGSRYTTYVTLHSHCALYDMMPGQGRAGQDKEGQGRTMLYIFIIHDVMTWQTDWGRGGRRGDSNRHCPVRTKYHIKSRASTHRHVKQTNSHLSYFISPRPHALYIMHHASRNIQRERASWEQHSPVHVPGGVVCNKEVPLLPVSVDADCVPVSASKVPLACRKVLSTVTISCRGGASYKLMSRQYMVPGSVKAVIQWLTTTMRTKMPSAIVI